MQSQAPGLSVRQFERYRCDLEAEITIVPGSAGGVKISRSVVGLGGFIPGRIIDCSAGGLSLQTAIFLPHHCRVTVNWPAQGAIAAGTVTCVVRRAAMADRTPSYWLGLSADNPEAEHILAEVTDKLRKSGAELVLERRRA